MRGVIVFLERVFRNFVVYPVLRTTFKNPERALPIDLAKVSSMLILRYDKIGDMIVTLPIFRIVKSHNPQVHISVVASEANADILRDEKLVDRVFVLYRNPFKLVKELYFIHQLRPDLVLNFVFNRITSGGLIANLLCHNSIKIGQGPEKYRFYFNVLLSLPRGKIHMFEMLVMYIEVVFGFRVKDTEKYLQFPMDTSSALTVEEYLGRHELNRRSADQQKRGQSYVVFNISAGQDDNRISEEQGISIAHHLAVDIGITTVVISSPQDAGWRSRIVREARSAQCLSFPDVGSSSLREVIALVEGALAVITPHTSIVHIAAATLTPVCGLFSPLQVNEEWLPYKVMYKFIDAGKGERVRVIPSAILKREISNFLEPLTIGVDVSQISR